MPQLPVFRIACHFSPRPSAIVSVLVLAIIMSCRTPGGPVGAKGGGTKGATILSIGEGQSAIFFADTGLALERAQELALRDAVAKAVGQTIESETRTYNMQFVADEITARSTALVRSHRVLEKKIVDDGQSYYARVEAEIRPDDIRRGLEHLLGELGNPKMMLVFTETIYIKGENPQVRTPGNTLAEIRVGQYLSEKGLKFVEKSVMEEIQRKNFQALTRIGGGDYAAAALLGQNLSEVVLVGEIESRDAGELKRDLNIDGGEGMYSAQAAVKIRVVDVTTGAIIAQESAQSPAAHIQKNIAAETAIGKTTLKLLPVLLEKIKAHYINKPRENEITVNMAGVKIGSPEAVALKSMLLSVTRAKKINAVTGKGDYIQWRVSYPGTAEGFMEEISVKQAKMGLRMDVADYNLGTVTYNVARIAAPRP